MQIKRYNIDVPYEKAGITAEGLSATLTAYTIDVSWEIGQKLRPAVVICPGGGYEFVSSREAEPVALRFVAMGINAFVLNYSVQNKPFPAALLELSQSVAFVRANAGSWDIDPNRISVCGFSAGGHLAASLGVHWNRDFIKSVLDYTTQHKPNALILCYPVISSGNRAHKGSIANIIGPQPTYELAQMVLLEKQVGYDTPETFIWHCADDDCVPVENSLDFASALAQFNISFEMHIYPHGGHGLSLCDDTTASKDSELSPKCAEWFQLAVNWIKK